MRIAVSCHPTQGGSGILASELAMALAARGHQVHLAACCRPFRLLDDSGVVFHQIDVPDYPIFRCPPHDLAVANKLAVLAGQYDLDIIHAHYAIPHSVMALLAREVIRPRKVRVVTTLHGTDITLVGSHEEFFGLTSYAMASSDALTAVSKWLREETQRRFHLAEPPQVIHNFFRAERFNPAGRADYPSPGEEFRLLHASNLRPVKRVTDIIRVFHLVQQELPARLTIVGDGPEKGIAEELVAELGLCKKVEFREPVRNIQDLIRSSHLFMLLSEYESFGLSVLEAMACGTPVAATCNGGLPEVVADGVAGVLCPVGDVSCTAGRITALLKDGGNWRKTSEAAARHALDSFEAARIVPLYEALYEKAITG